MPKSGRELLAALRDLRRSITAEAAERIERWQRDIEQPSFTASASNLAHYLAFRHHDLRELQRELMRHGLSSLGRLESRVMVTLQTVESALDALLSGAPAAPDWPPSSEQFFRGEAQLPANTHALLGGSADHAGPHPGDAADRGGAGPGLHAGDRAARRRCRAHQLRARRRRYLGGDDREHAQGRRRGRSPHPAC